MRLACPNCDAKYEVPDDAIPEGGRDVQCSACGHAWFQLRPEAEMAAEEEAALYGDDVPAAGADAVTGAVRAAVAETAPPPASPAAAAAAADEEDEDDAPAPARRPAPDAMAPALEDSVLAVLREEAEREAEARRQEAQRAASRTAEAEGQMQTQPDLGMETAAAGAAMTATQRRLAMLKGEDPDAPPPAPMKPPARRDLLPDVEEINSTLQPGETAGGDDVDALPDLTKSGSGFRTGFFLALFLLAVAAVVYVAAPSIGAAVPALDGAMAAYVAAVDGLRAWLNDLLNSASDTLNPGG